MEVWDEGSGQVITVADPGPESYTEGGQPTGTPEWRPDPESPSEVGRFIGFKFGPDALGTVLDRPFFEPVRAELQQFQGERTALLQDQAADRRHSGNLDAVVQTGLGVAFSAAATAIGAPVFDWLSNAWGSVTEFFNPSLLDAGTDLGDLSQLGEFGVSGFGDSGWPEISSNGGDWMRLAGAAGEIFTDTPNGPPTMIPGVMQATALASRIPAMLGAGAAEVAMRTGGAMAGMTLATVFGGARAAASFTINGIRGTVPQLWKYTRRFGPQAVATALGIGVAELGAILLQNPERHARRRRGISARDIRTTKRVVGFVSKMAQTIGCVRAPRHFTKRRS